MRSLRDSLFQLVKVDVYFYLKKHTLMILLNRSSMSDFAIYLVLMNIEYTQARLVLQVSVCSL